MLYSKMRLHSAWAATVEPDLAAFRSPIVTSLACASRRRHVGSHPPSSRSIDPYHGILICKWI